MAQLHYLTVQDVLWVHLQVTNRVESYDYARLEEAVFYQYAYGDSTGLLPQASRFLGGFVRQHPFEQANEKTAFLACAAFLRLNGKALNASAETARELLEGGAARVNLETHVDDAPHEEHLDTKGALGWALQTYGELAATP